MFPKRIDTSDLPRAEVKDLDMKKHKHLRTSPKGYVSMLPKEPIPPRGYVSIGGKD